MAKINCDNCSNSAVYICICRRCNSEHEDDEKFFACEEHFHNVDNSHFRVRGYSAMWAKIIETSDTN